VGPASLLIGIGIGAGSTGAAGTTQQKAPEIAQPPDVRGMPLPDARKVLKTAGVQAGVTSDGLFGILVPEHFIVCDEITVNPRFVRLEVSNKGC
jgi:hypothetical protein